MLSFGFISTPRLKRKRLRSTTPSDGGGGPSSEGFKLQSPLAKRKKLAAERTGYSKLKEGITADDLLATKDETASNGSSSSPKVVANEHMDDQEGEGDDEEEEEEEDEEDDFLARELEEEWG